MARAALGGDRRAYVGEPVLNDWNVDPLVAAQVSAVVGAIADEADVPSAASHRS